MPEFNGKNLYIGLDIGSTTVKAVVASKKDKKTLASYYKRHNAEQIKTALAILKDIFAQFDGAVFQCAVCGSGGKPAAQALGTHYVQEVVANAACVRTFYPKTRVAVELGGQDAKIIFFYFDEATQTLNASDMRMNGSCAGGTGAFIDEVANLLKIPVEEFDSFASRGTVVYEISGRCGVFAKTDIQPLLNQGVRREDIALSTFHAIVKQTIGGLAQGLELKAPILFEGGPLSFNPTLIRVFKERANLGEDGVISVKGSETMVALGAALCLDYLFSEKPIIISPEKAIKALENAAEQKNEGGESGEGSVAGSGAAKQKLFFENDAEKDAFYRRHENRFPRENALKKGMRTKAYLGIDAGSTTTKFVLIDEDENLLYKFYSPNEGAPLALLKRALTELGNYCLSEEIELEISGCGTTGYGEHLFAKALSADFHTVETVAHAAAAGKYIPGATFILDIGGQDMKAITIHDGIVTNITLNEACSSGCGSFLANFAATLNIKPEEIAQKAFSARNPAELGSRCTVFMNSSIITEQKNGKNAADIMAGLCRSIIENVFTKVLRTSNFSTLGTRIVAQGGTFKNDAVLRALEQYTGLEITRAPYSGEMGALGIALLTKRHCAEKGIKKSSFIGLEALKNFTWSEEENCICPFCSNNCSRTLLKFNNGASWVTGNRCERGEIVGEIRDEKVREKLKSVNKSLEAVPDLFKKRTELLLKDYPVKVIAPLKNYTIGLPRALDFWGSMPFWTTFYRALGFKVKISDESSRALFESGLPFVPSDTACFPAKLCHGHIQNLALKHKVDKIFMPMINSVPSENREKQSTYTCSLVKGYPLALRYSDDPERRWNVPFDTPMFHWYSAHDKIEQLSNYMEKTYGIPRRLTASAAAQGETALTLFRETLQDEGRRVLDEVKKRGGFAVVAAARHYQSDGLVNHNLSRIFTKKGIPVLTLDSLPGIYDEDLSESRLDIVNNSHNRLLSGAFIAARDSALEYVQIVSFGCGHDALLSDEINRILTLKAGKAPLILKLDESSVEGPLKIRVKSFIETIENRRKTKNFETKKLGEPFKIKFKKRDKKNRVILVPNVSRAFCKIASAAIGRQGFKVEPLPMGGKEAIKLGKKYVHNDICFPAQMCIGEALSVLQSGKYAESEVAVAMAQFRCDCRLTNYSVLVRRALDEAGFSNVPVVTTDANDHKNMHPGFKLGLRFLVRVLWCIIMDDIIEDIARKIRPYERVKGETNAVYNKSLDSICGALYKHGIRAAIKEFEYAIDSLCAVRFDNSKKKPVVFVTGEYLLNFHPGSNFYVEEYLEKNNMEVKLPRMYDVFRKYVMYTITEVKDFKVRHPFYMLPAMALADKYFDFILDRLEKTALRHPLYKKCMRLPALTKISDPVLHHSFNSGETYLIPADILHHASEGVRSFVILQPFGCLPNHICARGVVKRIKEIYPNIQILPLDYEPDTSFANIENRLQMLIMNSG